MHDQEKLPEELAKVVQAQFDQVLDDAQLNRYEAIATDSNGNVEHYSIDGFCVFSRRFNIRLDNNRPR